MSPTPSLKSSGLPRYSNLGEISCWLKINNFKTFKFAPIRKRFRDSGSASLYEQKCPPHQLSNPRGYRDTTILVKSADVKKSIMFNCIRFKKLLAFQEEDRSLKKAFFKDMIILYKIFITFSDLKNRCPHEPCKAIFSTFTQRRWPYCYVCW